MPKVSLGSTAEPSGGGSLPVDRSTLMLVVGWVIGFGLLAWMFVGARAREASLNSKIEAAQLDSARLEGIIKSTQDLERRRNIVAQKVTVVQDMDASRYVWAHLLDEVARAVPEYTWLVSIATMVQPDTTSKWPHFVLQGRTGNNFALTKYLQQLEASPFVRKVQLKESQLVREDGKLVYAFMLEADYEPPPPDLIERTPLFAAEATPDSVAVTPGRAAPAGGRPQGRAGRPPAPNAKVPANRAGSQERR
ncbi:MAG TPA: PilN domain-containing protein [Longimicrobiales bacterium]|nr:PilN domain-containing protein [Longimicrobiales bacterium]